MKISDLSELELNQVNYITKLIKGFNNVWKKDFEFTMYYYRNHRTKEINYIIRHYVYIEDIEGYLLAYTIRHNYNDLIKGINENLSEYKKILIKKGFLLKDGTINESKFNGKDRARI